MIYLFYTMRITDAHGIKQLYHGLSSCTGDNPLAIACGLSPPTARQTVV